MNVKLCDITLRDGEQAAGVNFFPEEKVRIAEKLALLNVPIIEAGFAIASPSDFKGIELVSKEIGVIDGPTICAMARANQKDVDHAAEALRFASKKRIQIVLSTSDIHLKHKLNIDRSEARALAHAIVDYASSIVDDVEFAAEDATRTDLDFLIEMFQIAVDAGARTVEIPDTVGYSIPQEYGEIVQTVVSSLPEDVIVSTHCHNDLGLAVANTLAGMQAGARQLEVTVNGIGERAGNAALEAVIMAMVTRNDKYNANGSINTKYIVETSALVSELSGIEVQKNKAIVGRNAFLHESGIHQHGMLKNRNTYEIIDPKSIGLDSNRLTLGKHSGKHALLWHLNKNGISLNDEEFTIFYASFKDMASTKKDITEQDLKDILP